MCSVGTLRHLCAVKYCMSSTDVKHQNMSVCACFNYYTYILQTRQQILFTFTKKQSNHFFGFNTSWLTNIIFAVCDSEDSFKNGMCACVLFQRTGMFSRNRCPIIRCVTYDYECEPIPHANLRGKKKIRIEQMRLVVRMQPLTWSVALSNRIGITLNTHFISFEKDPQYFFNTKR